MEKETLKIAFYGDYCSYIFSIRKAIYRKEVAESECCEFSLVYPHKK